MRLNTLKNLWAYIADKMTEIRIRHLPSMNPDCHQYISSLSICEIWVIMSLWQLRSDTIYRPETSSGETDLVYHHKFRVSFL